MSLFFAILGTGSLGKVTLSGATIDVIDGPGPIYAGVRINADGTVDKNEDLTYNQISAATDWIIPNTAAARRTYHVMATVDLSAGAGGREGATDTWLEIGVDSTEWRVFRGTSGVAIWNLTLAISNDGGATTLASAAYNLSVDVLV